jgi:hypothetical protein
MMENAIYKILGRPACLMHDGHDVYFNSLSSCLGRIGIECVLGSSPLLYDCPPEAFFPASRLFFIDVDCFEDKWRLVDALANFRSVRKDSVVCLVSQYFSEVDFGMERISICDGSVPKSMVSLSIVTLLRALCENNAEWRLRDADSLSSTPHVKYENLKNMTEKSAST